MHTKPIKSIHSQEPMQTKLENLSKSQKLKEITERMHELLPGLIELSFGCRIKHKNFTDCYYECDVPDGIIVRIEQQDRSLGLNFFYTESGARVHQEEISCCGKILGHPIHLEDLQLALFRSGFTYVSTHINADGKSVTVNVERIDESAGWNHWATCTGFDWLLKTPLELQSEETVGKLYGIFIPHDAELAS